LKFRKKYRPELLAFRAEMDGFENELRNAEDTKSMESVVVRSQERIEKECSDLAKALKGSAIQTFLCSIQTFLRAPSPYVIAAGSVVLNKATELAKVPVEYTIAGARAGGAIEVSVQYLMQRRERSTNMHKSPFAYLFLKERKLR
jgi:hypothetical protein